MKYVFSPSSRGRRLRIAALAAVIALSLTACSGEPAADTSAPASEAGSIPEGIPTLDEMYAGFSTEPPTTGPAPAEDKSVWFIACSMSATSCSSSAAAAEEAGAAIGWDVTSFDGEYNVGGAWATGIRSAIAAQADAIILDGISCPDTRQALEEAKDAGIPVIAFYGNDCSDYGQGGPSLITVSMNFGETIPDNVVQWQQYGALQADYIINESGGNAKIIANIGSELQQVIVAEAFKEELAKCSGCEIVEEVPYSSPDLTPNGPWIQSLRSALVQHPDATAVYFPWEVMMTTLGGLTAVNEAGLDVTVFGGQGLPDGLDAVRSGDLTAIPSALPNDWVSWAAIDNLNRAFNGEDTVPQGIGFQLVDIDHNLPPDPGSSFETEVDWKAAYLELWDAS